ncbi:MAG: hypothetical protein IT342_27495 [Candidatus Melainabacteria bacterium]|nr:hypothetical protein [Candidatus Melainabacteria bacterium]
MTSKSSTLVSMIIASLVGIFPFTVTPVSATSKSAQVWDGSPTKPINVTVVYTNELLDLITTDRTNVADDESVYGYSKRVEPGSDIFGFKVKENVVTDRQNCAGLALHSLIGGDTPFKIAIVSAGELVKAFGQHREIVDSAPADVVVWSTPQGAQHLARVKTCGMVYSKDGRERILETGVHSVTLAKSWLGVPRIYRLDWNKLRAYVKNNPPVGTISPSCPSQFKEPLVKAAKLIADRLFIEHYSLDGNSSVVGLKYGAPTLQFGVPLNVYLSLFPGVNNIDDWLREVAAGSAQSARNVGVVPKLGAHNGVLQFGPSYFSRNKKVIGCTLSWNLKGLAVQVGIRAGDSGAPHSFSQDPEIVSRIMKECERECWVLCEIVNLVLGKQPDKSVAMHTDQSYSGLYQIVTRCIENGVVNEWREYVHQKGDLVYFGGSNVPEELVSGHINGGIWEMKKTVPDAYSDSGSLKWTGKGFAGRVKRVSKWGNNYSWDYTLTRLNPVTLQPE